MTVSLVIWILVAGGLFLLLIARIMSERPRRSSQKKGKHFHDKVRPLEMGAECDEFFITGDTSSAHTDDDYDEYYN